MTKRNPNQLSLDDAFDIPSPEVTQDDVVYRNRRTGKIVFGRDVDALVNGGQFNYPMALARFGVTHDDIVDGQGNYIKKSTEKQNRSVSKQTEVKVDLGFRALRLLEAMDKYKLVAGTEKNVRDLQLAGASDREIDRELYLHVINNNAADEAYIKAAGRDVLPKNGINIQTRRKMREDFDDFKDLSTNPDREGERDRLSETLSEQIK